MKKYRLQYFLRGGIGASLTGFGLSWAIETGFVKHQATNTMEWLIPGTLALVVFMSGICLLIDALRFRIKMDQERD